MMQVTERFFWSRWFGLLGLTLVGIALAFALFGCAPGALYLPGEDGGRASWYPPPGRPPVSYTNPDKLTADDRREYYRDRAEAWGGCCPGGQ